jgi:Ca-activated chloride channel homolog
MSQRLSFFFVLVFCLPLITLSQQKVQQVMPAKTRILFVLDGSGSMEALWGGNESRMDIAKRILVDLIDSLRANPDLELALRVYGHRFTRQANNCEDSKLEVPFAKKNHNSIITKIQEIKPKGVTPITYSLLQAANDFPLNPGYRNVLILITDGIESCNADPCAASVELQRKGVFLRPFVIGLGISGGKVLDCVGQYIDSQNSTTFNEVLNETIKTTFSKTTVSVELLNGAGQPTETNVNVGFVNTMTGASLYEFVHYLDKNGKPDSVVVDPVPGYDVVVNTLPQVKLKNVSLKSGSHNVVQVSVQQGSLIVKPEGRGNAFNVLVRQARHTELLNQQRSGESVRYLSGDYEIETLTLPRRTFTVTIEPEKLKTVTLPQPGLININTLVGGYGNIFEFTESGESKWVCSLNENESLHSFTLLPGKYKIAFRSKKSPGSKYTAIKNFEIKSGVTVNLPMF